MEKWLITIKRIKKVSRRDFAKKDTDHSVSAADILQRSSLPDPGSQVSSAMEILQRNSLPGVGNHMSSAMEMLQRNSLPGVGNHMSSAMEILQRNSLPGIGSHMSSAMKILQRNSSPGIENYMSSAMEILQRNSLPDIGSQVVNAIDMVQRNTFVDSIGKINWENFKLTDDELRQAWDEIENENVDEVIEKDISENKDNPGKIKKSVKNTLFLIYQFVFFISSLTQVIEFTEERVNQVTKLYNHYKHEGEFQSEDAGIKWLSNELKSDSPDQMLNSFRIVTKENLIVREGKKRDSRIAGKLDTGFVVQILEKKRNWSYVLYADYENDVIIEGWTLTRHLKRIK